jgi:integrin beta 2
MCPCCRLTSTLPTPQIQGLNNAVALDFDYREQMIYWTDVTTQGSMIRRMHLNGSNVQVRQHNSPSQLTH